MRKEFYLMSIAVKKSVPLDLVLPPLQHQVVVDEDDVVISVEPTQDFDVHHFPDVVRIGHRRSVLAVESRQECWNKDGEVWNSLEQVGDNLGELQRHLEVKNKQN